MFKTRFTEHLGVEFPIQCGTMMNISDGPFVAAGANAGIFTAWPRPCSQPKNS